MNNKMEKLINELLEMFGNNYSAKLKAVDLIQEIVSEAYSDLKDKVFK